MGKMKKYGYEFAIGAGLSMLMMVYSYGASSLGDSNAYVKALALGVIVVIADIVSNAL